MSPKQLFIAGYKAAANNRKVSVKEIDAAWNKYADRVLLRTIRNR